VVGTPFTRLDSLDAGSRAALQRALEARASERLGIDAVVRAAAGRPIEVTLSVSPLGGGDIFAGLAIIARDTTRQKAGEAALRASERRFRDLAESLPHMVWTCLGDGPCDYLSPQWVAYTGIPECEQLGYGWLAQLHPDDTRATKERWAAAAREGGHFDVEFRIRRHDGVYRWFKTRAVPIFTPDGKIAKWFGSNTDIQDLRDARDAAVELNRDLESRVKQRTDELRDAHLQLQSVARQLLAAQRLTKVGSWELHAASGVVTWSEELFRIFGLDSRQPAPPYLEQEALFAPESWARLRAALERALTEGTGYELSLVVQRADDGRQLDTVARAEVVRGASGRVERLVGTLQDVTERESARRKLTQLSERLGLATSAAKMGVWDWNVETNSLVWDETMHRLYAVTLERFNGAYDAWRAALHPDDRADAEEKINQAVTGPGGFDTSFRIVRGDGQVRYLSAAATIHRDPLSGRATRMVGVNWDITEQRLAELGLQRSEALQRVILEHAGLPIIATDIRGIITLFNPAAESLLGYRASELIGKVSPAVIHDPSEVAQRRARLVVEREDGAATEDAFEVVVAKSRQGEPDISEWTYIRKDGSRVPVLLTVTTLFGPDGGVTGYLGVAIDLTVRKQQESELLTLNRLLAERSAQAESASRAKSAFLANMSHEIRTPLGAITGVTYLLSKTPLSPEQAELLGTIQQSAKTLLGMINDVLDLSKIEAGQLSLEPSPFRLSAVIDELAGLMRGYAGGKEVELVVDCDPALPEHLIGDRLRITQVLTNLVGNAIKFTDQGTVRLEVGCRQERAERVSLRFVVHDTGPGVDDELMLKLFSPFTQGGAAGARRPGGSGLGLAIVKELVTLMGGSVGIERAAGQGSSFWCEIPFGRWPEPEQQPASAPLDILIVDDHEAQRAAIARSACRFGWRVQTAVSARQALLMLQQAELPFDVVIADWRMPDMNGPEMLEALRETRYPSQKPPGVLLMSGSCNPSAPRWQPGSRGPVAMIRKPITSSALFDAVANVVAERSGGTSRAWTSQSGDSAERRLAGLRILLVDDNEINRSIAGRILQLEGASVIAAEGGSEAMARLREDAPFDLVLMDVQMPDLDGIETTRRIRAASADVALPIVALTAGALASERERALDAGMNDFISKPFDPDLLIACVCRHVGRRRRADSPAAPPAREPEEDAPWPLIEGIDIEDARRRLGGDLELFLDLLSRLMAQIDAIEPSLAASVSRKAKASVVHRLRGAAGNLGAAALQRAAADFEQALLHEPPLPGEPEPAPMLEQARRLRSSLSALPRTSDALRPQAPLEPRRGSPAAQQRSGGHTANGVLYPAWTSRE
jgi:PAS domain S-box-containing protein